MVTRISQEANHNLRIKARVRARGSRGQNWYSETRSQFVKKKARTQSLWMLHLAGDFHHTLERETPRPKPILMRVMLVSNLDVKQRFANGTSHLFGVYACMSSVTGCVLWVMHFMLPLGTQGRLLSWFPDKLPHKKAISASCPELTARFMKESALEKKQMLADIDFIDCNVRQENINLPGQPVLIQLGLVPCYGLTGAFHFLQRCTIHSAPIHHSFE